jgi:hypothetical protein
LEEVDKLVDEAVKVRKPSNRKHSNRHFWETPIFSLISCHNLNVLNTTTETAEHWRELSTLHLPPAGDDTESRPLQQGLRPAAAQVHPRGSGQSSHHIHFLTDRSYFLFLQLSNRTILLTVLFFPSGSKAPAKM